MKVLMAGVDESTRGGMWTVVENYLNTPEFVRKWNLSYVPTAIVGSKAKKVLFMLKAYWKIIRIFQKEHVDLIHIHMSERGSIYRKGLIMYYARRHGSKVLLHMHGAEFEVWYTALPEKRRRQVRDIINLADQVVILGDYWKTFMSAIVSDPGKIRVIHNAVPVPESSRYSPESRKLLFLGAVSRRKGIYDLLDAMQKITGQLDPSWQLEIYGPDVIGNIREEIEDRKLENRVHYCGWLDSRQKAEVLAQTAINILPSYNEGLPMTIVEAMAAGVPSVSTRVAAIPEAVTDENGVLLEPGDTDGLAQSILTLCTEERLRMEKSGCSYKTAAEKFSLDSHIRRIEKTYKELLGL